MEPIDTVERLVGRWDTQGAHPLLPGDDIRGHTTFEWLDGRKFLIQRSHYDHPRIPDAVAVIGVTDGETTMHYFDSRGVFRVYRVGFAEGEWRYWRDDPDMRQRFTGRFSDDGDTIVGQGEMDQGSGWTGDLALTYRRS